jgi:hypothetical protein
VDGKAGAVVRVESSSVLHPSAFGISPRPVGFPAPRAFFRLRADVEHFQPGRVLFGSMAEQIQPLNLALLPIALGEID